jgi:MFS family permease
MKPPINSIPFNPARWPFFYGWNILLWGTLGILLSAPGQTTGVSAFTEPLLDVLGISRLQLSMAYMIGTLASSFLLTPAGKLYDRLGSRWMGTASCFMLGSVLLLLSQVDRISAALAGFMPRQAAALLSITVLFFLLRFSGQGVLALSSRNMLMKWFKQRRGLVSGISGVALGYGFAITPALCSRLIGRAGWDGSWQILSIGWLLIFTPLVLIFFRDNPEDCGLIPDGKRIDDTGAKKSAAIRDFTLPEARRTLTFWVCSLALAVQALTITAITFHIESIFTQSGLEGARGFAIFPSAALIGAAATLIGGWLSDRLPLHRLYSLFLLAMSGSIVGFVFLSQKTIPLIIICFGIAGGLFGLLMSVTWPKYFGRRHLGAISGLNMSLLVFGSAIGPMLLSLSLTRLGSYRASLLICLGVTLLLFIGSFFAHNPQDKHR